MSDGLKDLASGDKPSGLGTPDRGASSGDGNSKRSLSPSAAAEWFPRHNPWLIAFVVMLSTFMQVLDTSIANVSLPHIAGNLSAGVEESTWVLTSYLVANSIVLPLSGWLSSLIGRKRLYMICVATFTLSSLLCGLAPSLGFLVFFRILQGAGGGALQPVSQAILVESFPHEKRGMAMAVYGMGVVFAPIIGPTLGGWITDSYSWRWIFLINIPVGALSLILTFRFVHDPPYLVRSRVREGYKIDYIGLGLLSVGLGFLQVMFDKGQNEGWFESSMIRGCALLAVIGLVGVVFWELRRRHPVVDLRLLKNRNFALSTITMFAMGMMMYGSTVLLPIMLQTLMGYTAMLSGMVISPGGMMVIVFMPLVGFLSSRVEARWLVVVGVAVSSMGLFVMSGFNLDIDFKTAMIARVIQSAGMAFLFVPINTLAFAFVAKEKVNNATGLINLARNVGGSVGISMVTALIARRAQFHHNVLVSHLTPYDPAYQQMIQNTSHALMGAGANPNLAFVKAHGLLSGMLYRQSHMLAFVDVFRLLGVMFLIIIPLMFLMKKTRPGKGPMASH